MSAPGGPRAELIPGCLPANLPVEVPVPEGARLLGSLAGDGPSWVIVFDLPGSVADAVAFCRDALIARGWIPPGIAKAGGFRAAIEPGATTFCKGPGGPWLTLEARAGPATPPTFGSGFRLTPDRAASPPPGWETCSRPTWTGCRPSIHPGASR